MNTAASPSLESGMDGEDIAMVAYAHQVGGGVEKRAQMQRSLVDDAI